MIDVGGFEVFDVATLTLRNPQTDEELIGAEIDLMGSDSAPFQAMVFDDARKRMAGEKVDPEETSAMLFNRCCALTVAIRGITANGEPVVDAADLYRRFPWAYSQAQAFILRRANFMRPA